MTRMPALLLAAALLVATAACGQKGDLYLPDQHQSQDQEKKTP
jgi:predicted small lipoprotein YifL